jgi:single-stranded DNA-binding protein
MTQEEIMTIESITGKVASDPTTGVMRDGTVIARFFIQDEQSEYHQVACYYTLAGGLAAFLKIGTLVTIRGKIKVYSWIDHNGIKHW